MGDRSLEAVAEAPAWVARMDRDVAHMAAGVACHRGSAVAHMAVEVVCRRGRTGEDRRVADRSQLDHSRPRDRKDLLVLVLVHSQVQVHGRDAVRRSRMALVAKAFEACHSSRS